MQDSPGTHRTAQEGPLEPGRELDRLIAERIFGMDPLTARIGGRADGDLEYCWGYPLGHDIAPHYSTSLDDAWRVVEHLRARWAPEPDALFWRFVDCREDGWEATIWRESVDGKGMLALALVPTLAEAICQAALNLKEVDHATT